MLTTHDAPARAVLAGIDEILRDDGLQAAEFQRVGPTLGLRAGEGLKEKAQHLKRRLLKWIEARFLYGDFLVFRDAPATRTFRCG